MENSSVSLSLQHNIHPSIYYSVHLKQLSLHEESTKKGLTLHTTSSAPPPFQLSVGSSMPFLITQGFSIMAHDALSPHWHDYEVHFCLFVLIFRWSTYCSACVAYDTKKQMCVLSTKKEIQNICFVFTVKAFLIPNVGAIFTSNVYNIYDISYKT